MFKTQNPEVQNTQVVYLHFQTQYRLHIKLFKQKRQVLKERIANVHMHDVTLYTI
jgi:hypothetical protein